MSQIKITRGSVSPGDIEEYHLVTNHLLDRESNIDQVIMYAEQRYLFTLLVSGATGGKYTVPGYTPKGGDTVATKIKPVPQGELIDKNTWGYQIMGRIQKESEIIGTSAVGTPTAGTSAQGGFFKLYLADNYMTYGMNCVFPNGKLARVMSLPKGVDNKYLYEFQTYSNETFNWATWVGIQSGRKTVFGGFTTFGERSRNGYGNFHYPDTYIQHGTTQRKSISISGHANANNVIWLELNGVRGMMFEAEQQSRAQFLMEDEFKNWWGVSTMRDAYGNLLNRPSMEENGRPIWAGDGYVQNIRGANDLEASGTDGLPTYEDFKDFIVTSSRKKNTMAPIQYFAVTGKEGIAHAEEIAFSRFSQYNLNQTAGGNTAIGGENVAVGYKYRLLNIAGEQIMFVENPMMDDEKKFPLRMSNGKLRMSCTYYMMDLSDMNGLSNVEIRARGRKGVNRNFVYYWENGMTGEGTPNSTVDETSFNMLKETFLAVRSVKTQGIIEPSLNV